MEVRKKVGHDHRSNKKGDGTPAQEEAWKLRRGPKSKK